MSTDAVNPTSPVNYHDENPAVIMLSGRKFLLACAAIALVFLILGQQTTLPAGLLAAEVFATILGLFLFGSFRYQIHKNALTYGMLLVIVATFCGLPTSDVAQRDRQEWLVGVDRGSTCCRSTGSTTWSMPTRCCSSSA